MAILHNVLFVSAWEAVYLLLVLYSLGTLLWFSCGVKYNAVTKTEVYHYIPEGMQIGATQKVGTGNEKWGNKEMETA